MPTPPPSSQHVPVPDTQQNDVSRPPARQNPAQATTGQHAACKVRIGPNIRSPLSSDDTGRLIEITLNYFPDAAGADRIISEHIRNADSLRLARDASGQVAGFSIASASGRMTPFHSRPIPLIYQRMLYLTPEITQRGLGKHLLTATFRDLPGPLWVLRRFALVCRTINPVVARMMDMHSVSWPRHGQPLPDEIRQFGESLLPMLGASRLDKQCRLIGTLDEFRGVDYTDIWNRHLHKRHNSYEQLMLERAFTQIDGRIINNGALILMLAYSRPLQFLCYLFH